MASNIDKVKMTFINRERELGALNKFWKEAGAQLIVIYGKRRIGKTELIRQFIKGKPHVFSLANKSVGINVHNDLKRKPSSSIGTGMKELNIFACFQKAGLLMIC